MSVRKHIPNGLTLMNLLSGCISILFVFREDWGISILFLGLALLFDFLDGLAARLLRVKSSLGKELDSLADLISFGMLPGFILFALISHSNKDAQGLQEIFPYFSLLVPVCSALRLARFTLDQSQEEVFRGLPTPALAIFIGSLPMVLVHQPDFPFVSYLLTNSFFLIVLTLVLSTLLLLPIRMFSLKFSNFIWQGNEIRFLFLSVAAILIIFWHYLAFPILILVYIMVSLIFMQTRKTP